MSAHTQAKAVKRFSQSHLLVELCGGGMTDFNYRNAIRHPSDIIAPQWP
jgi:hypothetical protein